MLLRVPIVSMNKAYIHEHAFSNRNASAYALKAIMYCSHMYMVNRIWHMGLAKQCYIEMFYLHFSVQLHMLVTLCSTSHRELSRQAAFLALPQWPEVHAAQLAGAAGRGCRFLVAGRVNEKKSFLTLADVAVPPQLQRMVWPPSLFISTKVLYLLTLLPSSQLPSVISLLTAPLLLCSGPYWGRTRLACLLTITQPGIVQGLFEAIPETSFRLDVSSTELRRKSKGLA